MKGNNTLQINQATMCEAVQMWVDSIMPKKDARVKRVKRNNDSIAGSDQFDVDLETIEEKVHES